MTIVFHERYLDHRQGGFMHPESPERLEATISRLKKEGFWKDVLTPGPAKMEDLLLVHTEEYLDMLKNFGEGPLDPDTYMRPDTWDIALLSAGGGILAGDTAYEKEKPVMALLRPPGHHATPYRAMGFCYLNNIAISAAKIAKEHKGRVAIIDIDLHHGNGTMEMFEDREDVLYISTHQFPHYPGTGGIGEIGSGKGKGYTVNIPLPTGAGDATFDYAFDKLIEPIVRQYKPIIILVSIGGDSHYSDPLGGLTLSSEGYIRLANRMQKMAKDLCKGRIAYFLEGGYNVEALAEVLTGIVASFEGMTTKYSFKDVTDKDCEGGGAVDKVAETLKGVWKLK
jgi:acetoin utilization deacetylase AcuC-like enzyme